MFINHVWLRPTPKPLSAADRFNGCCWRALGHATRVYTCADLLTLLEEPHSTLNEVRPVLQEWITRLTSTTSPSRDLIYSAVDLAKCYLAATIPGVTLDLKVGPSKWLDAYSATFAERFVSFSKGTARGVENQCAGTLSNELRAVYAQAVARQFKGLKALLPNQLSGFHAGAWEACGKLRHDTAKQDPVGVKWQPRGTREEQKLPPNRPWAVQECGSEWSRGPFRVFKLMHDQTNQPAVRRTTALEVKHLAAVALKELQPLFLDDTLADQARATFNEMPGDIEAPKVPRGAQWWERKRKN